jgi:hypothetical protein
MYGWSPQPEDKRDWCFRNAIASGNKKHHADQNEPSITHLLPFPRYEQGRINSCVTETMLTAWRVLRARNALNDFEPSRLEHYWKGRRQSGLHKVDGGGYPRDFAKAMHHYGTGPESGWPFRAVNVNKPPPIDNVAFGCSTAGIEYYWIKGLDRLSQIEYALKNHWPVCMGTMVGREWNEYAGYPNVLGLPNEPEKTNGHYVLITRVLATGECIIRNWWSWGRGILSREVIESPLTRDIMVMTRS